MNRLQEDIKSLEASAQACLEVIYVVVKRSQYTLTNTIAQTISFKKAADDQPEFYERCHDFTTFINKQLTSAQSDQFQVLTYLKQTLFPTQPPAHLVIDN